MLTALADQFRCSNNVLNLIGFQGHFKTSCSGKLKGYFIGEVVVFNPAR